MRDKVYITFLPPYVAPEPQPEPETTAYMTAAGIPNDSTVYFPATAYQITGSAMWTALDDLVVGLKNLFGLTLGVSSLLNQFVYFFPRLGGTATAHAVDLVSGFSGTFSGGWTHDGSGALPNGVNAYFNTGYLRTNLSQNNVSAGFWSKTDANGLFADFGSINGANATFLMYARNGGNTITRLSSTSNDSVATADSLGHFSMSRDNSANYRVFKNGSLVATHTRASTGYTLAQPILEACTNNDPSTGVTPIQYSPRKRTIHYAGLNISTADMASFHTILNTFETALNR